MRAYILVQVESGALVRVASEERSIKGVTAASAVTGPYDVIVEAESRSLDELARQVLRPVQALAGVSRTLTCPVVIL